MVDFINCRGKPKINLNQYQKWSGLYVAFNFKNEPIWDENGVHIEFHKLMAKMNPLTLGVDFYIYRIP